MRSLLIVSVVVSLTAAVASAAAVAADAKPLPFGAKVPNLTFKDIRYLPRTLSDFGSKKAFVLVFTTTGCPLVERYLPVLQKLESAYRAKDVQFVAINVGGDDSILAMAAHAVEHGVEFPCVKDSDGKWAPALGVKRTPEVVVLDAADEKNREGNTSPFCVTTLPPTCGPGSPTSSPRSRRKR